MDDELRMGIRDRTDDLHESRRISFRSRPLQYASIAMPSTYSSARYGRPFTEPGVVQHGDMRVLQPRQDRALARDALAQALIDPLGTWQLQCRRALHHAVGTRGHPHCAHAAFGQQSRQLPWADPITGLLAPHRGQRLRRNARNGR